MSPVSHSSKSLPVFYRLSLIATKNCDCHLTPEVICPTVEDRVTALIINVRAYFHVNLIIRAVRSDLNLYQANGLMIVLLHMPTKDCQKRVTFRLLTLI